MIYLLDRFGNTFDQDVLKSPISVDRAGKEPGPPVTNNPVARPDDPLRYSPENSRRAGKGR